VRCGRAEKPLRRGLCHADYERDRRQGKIAPRVIDVAPVRRTIILLVGAGWKYREIARAAHVHRSVITHILAGRQVITATTAHAICGIDPATRQQYRQDGWATRRTNAAALADLAAAAESCERERREDLKFGPLATGQRTLTFLDGPFALNEVESWRDEALCAETDPEVFFPEKGGSTREAKRICLRCTVRDDCLEFALAHDERFGVWAGLSEQERRRLKRGLV